MSGWGFDGSLGEARRKGPWRKLTSNPTSSIFLGLSMGVASVLGTQAADLPSRKAAPVEYVRICDAYGSGFFFIPGTDTCLRVGGTVVAEWRAFSNSYRMSRALMGSGNIAAVANPFSFPRLGFVPSVGAYGNATGGNNQGFQGVGRIELDARTATPVGALRTFVRIESLYASEGFFDTAGSLTGGANFATGNYGNPTVFNSSARETTILNKAFIQFAGLTAGRVQSFFDFYTDEVNWEVLRGSNATVGALAYTQTFDGGFSGSLSIEDNTSRRAFIGSTIGNFNFGAVALGVPGVGFGTTYSGIPGGSRVPEIVGNLRWDQPWGAVQVSAAAHQLRTSLYDNPAIAVTPAVVVGGGPAYAFPVRTSQDYGFAVQLGTKLLLDHMAPEIFSPGDKFWLQATYEQGAVGYVMGNNLSFKGGPVNGDIFYGFGNGGTGANIGWDFNSYDCVWTAFGHCDKNEGWVVLAALKHYWMPTLSSGVFGSYMGLRYSNAAVAGVGNGVAVVNTDEYRVGSNLVWTPVKNFDVGGEVMYFRDNHLSRPANLAARHRAE